MPSGVVDLDTPKIWFLGSSGIHFFMAMFNRISSKTSLLVSGARAQGLQFLTMSMAQQEPIHWRYPLHLWKRPMFEALVLGFLGDIPRKYGLIWFYMVQYLHFRILFYSNGTLNVPSTCHIYSRWDQLSGPTMTPDPQGPRWNHPARITPSSDSPPRPGGWQRQVLLSVKKIYSLWSLLY